MNKRKILAISGARSDYDLLYVVYDQLRKDPDVDFKMIITGPNLSEKYGYTAQYIINDGFDIAGEIYNLVDSSKKIGRIISIGVQIPALANLLNFEKPDIVLVAGDREEAISVTMTCAYMDIAVAHFFGGDIAKDGNIDNSVRYAASKFAHIHFPTLDVHKQTLLKLGEDDWRIHVVGNPALDRILAVPKQNKNEIFSHFQVSKKNINQYCVLIQHPIITQFDLQQKHIKITLDSILKYEGHCFMNFPNSDAGSDSIIGVLQEYSQKHPEKFTLFQNLSRDVYINLLRNAEFLIGNSSSGILEVASLGLAAINIGDRQRGRIHGDNVIFVDNNKTEILSAIKRVKTDKNFKEKVALKHNPYGDGTSAEKIVKVLKEIVLNDHLIYKNITY